MFSKESFIQSFETETKICLRLYDKIGGMSPGTLDYRPTPGQRSTAELLRYLSYGPYNGTRRILAGDWSVGKPTNEVTKDMPPSDFQRNMRWQSEEISCLVRSASPIALENETITLPWGETLKKGEALVNCPLKWIVGYRMQLFLYLKAAGAGDLATKDLWFIPKEG